MKHFSQYTPPNFPNIVNLKIDYVYPGERAIACDILAHLNGMPAPLAEYILNLAQTILHSFQSVDTSSEAFNHFRSSTHAPAPGKE